MTIREKYEQREEAFLSPLASKAALSKGREKPEPQCDVRTVFQRDVGRIVHCSSFRRLKHKTQVFLSPDGDHYRTRLTHTLEVAQISRTIARALDLNEDLTEAIAMGHDLGHSPFGHAGERALDKLSPYGFSHNEQSLRVVDCLERNGEGLNLSYEVRNGILHHTGSPAETLEGRIVSLSDRIAYINSDIDDAVHAGILKNTDLPPMTRQSLGETYAERINTLVLSIIRASQGKTDISMEDEVSQTMDELRDFLFEFVYTNPVVKSEETKVGTMIENLYEHFRNNPDILPVQYVETIYREDIDRAVCDYIAGMTDTFAVKLFTDIYIPKGWNRL